MNIIADCSRITKSLGQWASVPNNEEEIIWLENPRKYFFVRTKIFWSARRDSKPKYIGGGKVIGYSVIKRGTKRNYCHFYERRFFYLTGIGS